jgi:hypothetical protein
MTTPMPHRKTLCTECPWATTTPPGQFPPARYAALQATTGRPGHEAPLGAPLFACHKSSEGKDVPCAGWLAAVGLESIQVRVLIAQGRLSRSVLVPGEDWPPLFASYAAMARRQGKEPTS